MQYHIKHVVTFRRRINLKMSPHLYPSSLHLHILRQRNTHQNFLQIWNILHRNNHSECLPIQNIAERDDITVFYQYRNAPQIEPLHHSWACNFVAAGADAVSASSHHAIVGDVFGQVFVDLNIRVCLVFPVLEEDRAYWTMDAASVED